MLSNFLAPMPRPLFRGLEQDDVIISYDDIEKDMEELGLFDEMTSQELFTTEAFKQLLAERADTLQLSEQAALHAKKWADIHALREHYAKFSDFLYDCMTKLMGFTCTDVQIDIGNFISDESLKRLMVQAQRSQAKSTIVAIYGVWKLIHNCKYRVLIISAGNDVAQEIANWIIQIIMTWDILECMRPDRNQGDRSSVKAFDVNWMLKGAEKSPSVACIGVTANMQGRRADLLVPDDIESSKNGLTETQRLALEHLSRDFASICQSGRICYMGTPQTVDSIYKNLPMRGYTVRVWTGRYPTKEELPRYGDQLAPYITERIKWYPEVQIGGGPTGTRGWAVDPYMPGLDEAGLTAKELDQGPEYFQLQHMLDTTLNDENRYPLKVRDLIIMDVPAEEAPGNITWLPNPKLQVAPELTRHYACMPELYHPFSTTETLYKYDFKYMHIDPAGSSENADEVAIGIAYAVNGYILYPEVIGLQGGFREENLLEIAQIALKHGVNEIGVEQNMGHGAFAAMLRPVLEQQYRLAKQTNTPSIKDYWESKQKEQRIIKTLSPLLARHKIIFDPRILEYDKESTRKYAANMRESYKLIHQMTRITLQKHSLIHDDRLDVVHACARRCIEFMTVDEEASMRAKAKDETIEFMKEWGAMTEDTGYYAASCHRFRKPSISNRRH